MKLKSFREFLNEEYLALESIRYLDEKVFKPFLAGKYDMTDAELKKWRNKQNLIKEDGDKYWLENDEEIKLIEQYQQDPNSPEGRDALNKLVENKIPYVKSKVGKFIMMHPEYSSEKEDMEQEALIYLTNAIAKFDTKSGTIFNAFANKYISGALWNHNNVKRQKSIVNGKGDSFGRNRLQVVSLDTPLENGGAGSEWADKDQTVADKIEDENHVDPWEYSDEEMEEHAAILHDWYETLPEQEKTAMQMYFTPNGEDGATFEEIGKVIGMSKMGVQKLINRVIIKVRKLAEKEGFAEPGNLRDDPDFYEKIIRIAKGKSN
jgi:RNA polymerase sigma factor (sigma-70 family)